MSTFDIMTEIENQECQIELSMAVLSEIGNYFCHYDAFKYLPDHAEHISNLLNVDTILLSNTVPELQKATDALLEKHKEEQKWATSLLI